MALGPVLFLDADEGRRRLCQIALRQAGFSVVGTSSLAGARDELARGPFSCVVLTSAATVGEDDASGPSLADGPPPPADVPFAAARAPVGASPPPPSPPPLGLILKLDGARAPGQGEGQGQARPALVVLCPRSAETAWLRAGADECVDEECSPDALVEALSRAEARMAARTASSPSVNRFSIGGARVVGTRAPALVGRSTAMLSLLSKLRRLAPHAASVMLYGESGTGKELAARALHAWSQRSDGPFVAVNVAAIPTSLFESALFGHVRGAFTDAVRDRPGFFEEADGGTLFLDEVADLPLASQVKLLRVLEDQSIRRVGENEERRVNVRVVAATARDLEEEARRGRFRDDLLFRVAGLTLRLPPLRERRDDIPVLVEHFIARIEARLGTQLGASHRSLTPAALDRLVGYAWPGNVRELENSLERAVVLCEGEVIDVRDLPEKLWSVAMRSLEAEVSRAPAHEQPSSNPLALKPALARVERELIRQALAEAGDRRVDAARKLGISHRTLLYKLKEYGLGAERER